MAMLVCLGLMVFAFFAPSGYTGIAILMGIFGFVGFLVSFSSWREREKADIEKFRREMAEDEVLSTSAEAPRRKRRKTPRSPKRPGVPDRWLRPGDTAVEGQGYAIRDGNSWATDEVFDAWCSGDIAWMVKVINVPTHPVDRHHLLNGIVSEAYRLRKDDHSMCDLCASTAETYLAEQGALMGAMDSDVGSVPVFKVYAMLLTEQGQFDKAIDICKQALQHGLGDGTKGGFEGRIQRINKLRQAKLKPA